MEAILSLEATVCRTDGVRVDDGAASEAERSSRALLQRELHSTYVRYRVS